MRSSLLALTLTCTPSKKFYLVPLIICACESGGGVGRHLTAELAPVLGGGYGTTGTRSVADFTKTLGLKTHHWTPTDYPALFWQYLCQAAFAFPEKAVPCRFEGLTEADDFPMFSTQAEKNTCAEKLNEFDFSAPFDSYDVMLDFPTAEFFLDFYAVSPHSKVILTVRPGSDWVVSRQEHIGSQLPIQSPCGSSLENANASVAAQVFEAHNALVRCMVPEGKLLEMNLFNGTEVDSAVVAEFLGHPGMSIPFPGGSS
mmetsp:Transcript_89918/g.160001  ORF Transcript_89918/g.160001 Transcript_89918/m.160001 type:complete len:257 (-) Transcript_89918:42-812(-)